MKRRCLDKRHPFFHNYGAKGIKIDPSWHDFRSFYADMGERPPGTSLDRIDGNLGYSKENCRWATKEQQSFNRATNRLFTIDGETKSLTEWANEYKVNPKLVGGRINRLGWNIKEVLTNPARRTR